MADKHVIVYEQDEKFTKALKLYFRGSAFDPTTVSDKDALLSAASGRSPDVLLVALENDDADSRALIETLTNDGSTSGRPIVVMSTKKQETELFADGVASLGASAYIKKPFIKKAILRLLDDVMAGGAPAPAKAAAKKDVSMGEVIGDVEAAVDDFFEKEDGGGDEFTISLEDEGGAPGAVETPGDDGIAIVMDDEPSDSGSGSFDVSAETSADRAFEGLAREPVSPMEVTSAEGKPGELKRLRRRIRELEDELSKKSIEAKAAAREAEKLEKGLGKKESELLERIRTIEKQNEDLEEDVKKRKQLVAQMTTSVTQLNEDIEERDQKHENELNELREQMSGLQAQVEELQDRTNQQAHDIEDRNEEIARSKRQIGDLEGERDELTVNLEAMTKSRDHLEHDLSTERARIDAGRRRFEEGAAELRRQLEAEMARVRETIERGLNEARDGMQRTREAIEQGIKQADEAMQRSTEVINTGLGEATSAASKTGDVADQVLREGVDALTGKH